MPKTFGIMFKHNVGLNRPGPRVLMTSSGIFQKNSLDGIRLVSAALKMHLFTLYNAPISMSQYIFGIFDFSIKIDMKVYIMYIYISIRYLCGCDTYEHKILLQLLYDIFYTYNDPHNPDEDTER